jgi:hypothetical protein
MERINYMATKKKTPEKVLMALFSKNEDGDDEYIQNPGVIVRDEYRDEYIAVDDARVSEIEDADTALASCCGVLSLSGVDCIGSLNKAAYKAIDALYTQHWKGKGFASVLASVNGHLQKSALAFFRATDWKEVPAGLNRYGQKLILFVKVIRKSKPRRTN